MIFTVANIARSLADYLAPELPGVAFYEGPNQQGSDMPCMFLQQRFSPIKLMPGGRWQRTIGLDLTYLVDFNLPEMQRLYEAAAEALDLMMETFPYSDGESEALVRTYEREWRIDQDAMHYKFELKVWVTKPKAEIPMRVIEGITEEVKE